MIDVAGLHGRTLYVRVRGAPNVDAIIEAIHTIYSRQSFTHVIWDYRDGSMGMIDSSELSRVSAAGRVYAAARGPNAKTAVVCASEAEIILTKALFAIAQDEAPVPYRAFATMDDAKAWLVE